MIGNQLQQGTWEWKYEELHWLERVRRGDEGAIAPIVARHRTRLIRVAANLLRDAHEAEDVAQEAFIRAFRELRSLREDRAFAGYLYRICVRLCMDRLRARKAEPAEFDKVVEDSGDSVDNQVVVRKLLDMLQPDLRTTLVLREMEQLSYEEIAALTRVPVGTVRSRLHSAREKFRALWLSENSDN